MMPSFALGRPGSYQEAGAAKRDPELGRSRFGALGQSSEALGILEGQLCENLSVDFDLSCLKARHQPAVRQPVDARGGVDARDPQPTEFPLALASIAICVFFGLVYGFDGDAMQLAAPTKIAFGLF